MRTWSVSGTALALCTRSSSLSMSTRTSMSGMVLAVQDVGKPERGEPSVPPRLFVGAERGGRAHVWVQLAEALRHHRGDESFDVPAERRDLLDAARRDESKLGAPHDVHRIHLS